MPTAADPRQIDQVRFPDRRRRPQSGRCRLPEMRKGAVQFFWLPKDILEKAGHEGRVKPVSVTGCNAHFYSLGWEIVNQKPGLRCLSRGKGDSFRSCSRLRNRF